MYIEDLTCKLGAARAFGFRAYLTVLKEAKLEFTKALEVAINYAVEHGGDFIMMNEQEYHLQTKDSSFVCFDSKGQFGFYDGFGG